eukprot:gene37524-63123_t
MAGYADAEDRAGAGAADSSVWASIGRTHGWDQRTATAAFAAA